MKTIINEWEEGFEITFEPETIEETTALMRFANNAKAEKPYVSFNYKSEPYMYVYMKKISKNKQSNGIEPKHQAY